MAGCPRCHRPLALLRSSCLYCGAPLPPEEVEAALRGAAEPPAGNGQAIDERRLLIADLESASPETAARALGALVFEVRLWARRGRFHLHGVLPEAELEARAAALRQAGVEVFVVAESTVKNTAPLRALGGARGHSGLRLRLSEGSILLTARDLLLAVRGPITREYQVPAELALLRNLNRLKRIGSASLTQGFRYHLHRRSHPQPVELDPGGFDFGADAGHADSSEQRLAAWMAELTAGIPVDDGFRHQAPALAPAAPEQGLLTAAEALGRQRLARGAQASPVLDNLAQFRFYSAWRGLVERQRAGLTAPADPVLPSGPDS